MSHTEDEFLVVSQDKAFDMKHRHIINYNIGKYDAAVDKGLSKIINLENTKRKGHVLKWKVMENLDKFLPEFEANFQKRGGKVHPNGPLQRKPWGTKEFAKFFFICGIGAGRRPEYRSLLQSDSRRTRRHQHRQASRARARARDYPRNRRRFPSFGNRNHESPMDA